MAKELTQAAQVAKTIRTALRDQGLAVTVTSRNYSMGNSVDVRMIDQRPEIYHLVKTYCANFQYGCFDAMTDCYEVNNHRADLPQAKHVFVSNDASDAMRETIYQFIRGHWHGGDALPVTYAEGKNIAFNGDYVDGMVNRLFRGDWSNAFWEHQKEQKMAAFHIPRPGDAAAIMHDETGIPYSTCLVMTNTD